MPLAVNLLDSLISYWELNEASGTRFDSHGSNTLTDFNTVTQNPGKVYTAAQFTAANLEELTCADNPSLSIGAGVPVTFVAWVYADTLTNNTGVLGKWNISNEYALEYGAVTAGRFEFAVRNPADTTTTARAATTFGAPSTATWYFLMAQYDLANLKISVNNGVVDSTSYTAGIRDATSTFRIGGYTAPNWDGRIDQVGMWKRGLSDTEISILYNSGFGLSYAALIDLSRISHKLG